MQKWEYKVVKTTGQPQGDQPMNELGAEGWELVIIVPKEGPIDWGYYYYFKRPK